MCDNNKCKSFYERFSITDELGRGAFATVYRCINRSTNKDYAAKVFKKKGMSRRDLIKLDSEVAICGRLKHPHIVRLHGVMNDTKYCYLIFDLVTGGELFEDIVESREKSYTEEIAAKCMHQLLDAVAYCHSMGVIHRDLKPENILLESKASKIIKVADFGLAVEVSNHEMKWFGLAGTYHYLAPEVLEMIPYGRPVDCWACGVILFILISGFQPFHHRDERRLAAMIKHGDYDFQHKTWDTVSSEVKDLIQKLLCVVPNKRITADQALKHPWFTKMNTSKEEFLIRVDTIERLKQFNARRKLKGAFHSQTFIASFMAWKKREKLAKSVVPQPSPKSTTSGGESKTKL